MSWTNNSSYFGMGVERHRKTLAPRQQPVILWEQDDDDVGDPIADQLLVCAVWRLGYCSIPAWIQLRLSATACNLGSSSKPNCSVGIPTMRLGRNIGPQCIL